MLRSWTELRIRESRSGCVCVKGRQNARLTGQRIPVCGRHWKDTREWVKDHGQVSYGDQTGLIAKEGPSWQEGHWELSRLFRQHGRNETAENGGKTWSWRTGKGETNYSLRESSAVVTAEIEGLDSQGPVPTEAWRWARVSMNARSLVLPENCLQRECLVSQGPALSLLEEGKRGEFFVPHQVPEELIRFTYLALQVDWWAATELQL